MKKPPLIIDNCVLGNLYSAGQISLLKDLYAGNLIIPNHVLEESSLKINLIRRIKKLAHGNWFEKGEGCKIY